MQAQVRDPLSFSLPRRVGTTGNQGQKSTICVLLGLLGRFFALPKRAVKTTSKKHRKKCENDGFWPPKTLPKWVQNAFKIDVPQNMRFCIDFSSKRLLPQKRRHRFRIGFSNTFCLSDTFLQIAFGMLFSSQKRTKNPSKTMSEPLKNRCRKRVVFQHRFFGVSASILEGLGPPRWSQVGSQGPAKLLDKPLFTLLS